MENVVRLTNSLSAAIAAAAGFDVCAAADKRYSLEAFHCSVASFASATVMFFLRPNVEVTGARPMTVA
ncbi:MAG: hypothetical protein O2975_03615 [Proteobacteria bacterium]|nr:hypothetical protein [Pseudomonadota bacterium]